MARRPEIGNVQLYPNRPLNDRDKNGYVLKFYCPIQQNRIRRNCGTRDRREARRIQRECRERLLNGRYVESGGAIVEAHEQVRQAIRQVLRPDVEETPATKSWQECVEAYRNKHQVRVRTGSHVHAVSRLEIAGRILDGRRADLGLSEEANIEEFATLEALEYLQERLLAGDEGRYDSRAPMTVNSMMGAVMAFVRFCKSRGWLSGVPPLEKLSVEEVMKGRPITAAEFQQMLAATPAIVGERSVASWQYVLQVLWESAFRVGDVMNFSWDDERRIHPIWPSREGHFPTLGIPSSQKNKKIQEIPMLPGLQDLLEQTPAIRRHGWVVNPAPIDFQIRSEPTWFKPKGSDLAKLASTYSNSAIGRACGVSDTTVRKWLRTAGILRDSEFSRHNGDITAAEIKCVRQRAERLLARPARRHQRRLTKERVGRIISLIGEKAGVIVRQVDDNTGQRVKYASATTYAVDAQRLINAGISAETLKLVFRHQSFSTTERYYGATRAAQSAAAEISDKLSRCKKTELVGGLVGGTEEAPQLSAEELRKLKALLNSL